MFLFLFLNVYTWQIWLSRKKLDLKTIGSKIKQLEQNFVQIFFVGFTSWARNHYGHVIIMGTCSLWARNHYFWKQWYPELQIMLIIVFGCFYIFYWPTSASQRLFFLLFMRSPFFLSSIYFLITFFVLHKSRFSRLTSDLLHSLFQLNDGFENISRFELRNVMNTFNVSRTKLGNGINI